MSDDRSGPPDEDASTAGDGPEGESAAEPALDDDATAADEGPAGEPDADRSGSGGSALAGPLGVAISALVGLAAAALSYWVVQGIGPFFEEMPRVQPTVENRGVGSDWVAGNTDPLLDAMIALVHAADVIMGVFILVMVFLHWAAFRRLAARMRPPADRDRSEAVAADGGDADPGGEAE